MYVATRLGILGLALALVGCGQVAATSIPRSADQASIARAVGGFTDLSGRGVALEQFRGRPVVLSFLSPGQADSQAQLPHLIRLEAAYRPEGVVFVLAGESATVSELGQFARDHGLTFPVWHDRAMSEFSRRGFAQLPAHEFVRADGSTALRHQGFMSRGELLAAIARIQP